MPNDKYWFFCLWHFAFCIALSGCAARRLTLPADAGSPFADFAQVHAQVSMACASVRTLTAELSLTGHAGGQRLRGRVLAGFERPMSMRLEGVAPFGPPAFILAASGNMATLLLPRDERVLRSTRAEDILEALTGVRLAPPDLLAIVTGCVLPDPRAMGGRLHANGWLSLDLGEAMLYLQRQGAVWRIRAARRGPWQIDYRTWEGAFPPTVRLQSGAGTNNVDLTASISQLETNVDLDPAAFSVNVPPDALALTLDELRERGPLRGN